ncbi:hypothetical protein N0V90_008940 [Kalmusia sp. IMI 367209]|nr:hypothetical protein N0V90_008940 [Kalmusia sp. IMI 367209]
MRLQRKIQKSLKDTQPTQLANPITGITEHSEELHNYHISQNSLESLGHEYHRADTQQRILNSLQFPQIQERRHQIHEAHEETYQWILRSVSDRSHQWDNLIAWLSSSTESRRIYWIYGKPGSGKSTMMRFLDQNLVAPNYMLPWTENRVVLNAQYFFWSPGSKLQKSIAGILRALLLQLLEKQPSLTPQVVGQRIWSAAQTPGSHPIEWTNAQLQQALYEYIVSVRSYARVFLLIDGLDELDGPDEARDELNELLLRIASLENVKICISSRPWNIFRDAFGHFPQLRLENLTHDDINSYVKAELHKHSRFRRLFQRDQANAENLIIEITQKAAGVFLWVRLVIRELLKGIRDGDGIHMLRKKLDELPGDLNQYFRRLMDSISPLQRQEASALLQIALYEEWDFDAAQPLRLIDLAFIDEGRPDFVLSDQHHFASSDLTDREALAFRLDSCFRHLNSRCMGLLECHYEHDNDDDDGEEGEEDNSDLIILPPIEERGNQNHETRIERDQSPGSLIFRGHSSLLASGLTVQFLHRSCRDFFLTPEIQDLLHGYTQGSYDARMFLLHARIAYFMSLAKAEIKPNFALTLASYVMGSLARPSYKHTPICTNLAIFLEPVLEEFIQKFRVGNMYGYYIYPSVVSWHDERSSFLTLAIDFELSHYVQTHLTPEIIKNKRGRPILDYMLRPRFADCGAWFKIGNRRPNLEFLRLALSMGADPNEQYGGPSVWALFLCFLADIFAEDLDDGTDFGYFDALEVLIRAGASAHLPGSWLSCETDYEGYFDDFQNSGLSPGILFSHRWPNAVPASGATLDSGSGRLFAVSDLLAHFRWRLGSKIDTLRGLLDNKQAGLM